MARLAFALLALCCLALPCVAEDLCLTYRETRLVIDRSLNEEAFSLREMSSAKLERIVGLGGDREILHRTYAMSLESANGIAVFKGEWGGTCYISRDIEQSKPISLPVFFIGQAGQTREDLEERIGRTKFASSLSLTPKQNFSEVNFLLSRGEWVGKVQAFFRCGLPGLLVCAETCPRESDPLVAALVNSVASQSQLHGQRKTPRHKNGAGKTGDIAAPAKARYISAEAGNVETCTPGPKRHQRPRRLHPHHRPSSLTHRRRRSPTNRRCLRQSRTSHPSQFPFLKQQSQTRRSRPRRPKRSSSSRSRRSTEHRLPPPMCSTPKERWSWRASPCRPQTRA